MWILLIPYAVSSSLLLWMHINFPCICSPVGRSVGRSAVRWLMRKAQFIPMLMRLIESYISISGRRIHSIFLLATRLNRNECIRQPLTSTSSAQHVKCESIWIFVLFLLSSCTLFSAKRRMKLTETKRLKEKYTWTDASIDTVYMQECVCALYKKL